MPPKLTGIAIKSKLSGAVVEVNEAECDCGE